MNSDKDNDLLVTSETQNEPEEQFIEQPYTTEAQSTNSKVEMSSSIDVYAGRAISMVQESIVKNGSENDFREGSKNIAHMVATADALNEANGENEQFLKQIRHEKQEEIKESFKSERYKEQAKTLESKRKKAEEFYNNFRPILEFDFSPLIPKNSKTVLFRKKVKTDKRGNVLPNVDTYENTNIPNQSKDKPTYEDRSYGIPLMCLMLVLLTVPYCFVTILLAIFNGVNALFDGIARFGKPALIICGSGVGVTLMVLFVYFVLMGLDRLFGTNILSSVL